MVRRRLAPLGPATLRARRLPALAVLVSIGFTLVVARLAVVQVSRHASLAEAAVRQRAQTVPLSPDRGSILDRNGVPLSDRRLAYRVAVYPAFFPPGTERAGLLASALGLTPAQLRDRLNGRSGPLFVARGLEPDRAAAVMGLGLEGVAVVADETRYGPRALARHTVGYANGSGGDGLEKAWDHVLGGRGPHLLALFVDGRGEPLPGPSWRKLFSSGGSSPWTTLPCDLVTTIDSRIQGIVEEVMDRLVARGAVMVMDPSTGDILAMASRPDYNQADVGSYLGRTDGCLVNRAVWAYPPGSVVKPLVMAGALEDGVVWSGERFACRGSARAAGREFGCTARERGGHGDLTLAEALAVSCNVVFVKAGERLGQDRLTEWAARFGLGRPAGTGLPGEKAGSLPPPAAERSEPEAAFGQGSLTVTPLQVACLYATIANGGRRVVPRLVKEIVSPIGARVRVGYGVAGRGERLVSAVTAAEVTRALVDAVRRGTGKAAAVTRDVAGKTGTAETGRASPSGRELHAGWFAGFWPAYDPRLVIVVLIEDTPGGGGEAAIVFGEVLRRVLSTGLVTGGW